MLADQVLLYATGGLAFGHVSVSANTYVNGTVTNVFPPTGLVPFVTPGTSALSASKTIVGFAVGLGMEAKCSYLLPTGWTWKLEYLYVDLGSLDTVSAFPAALPVAVLASPLNGTFSTHTHFTDNIVRVGLNYKFGEYAPVITAPPNVR